MTDKLRAAAQAVERLKPFVHGLGKSILEELKDALAQQEAEQTELSEPEDKLLDMLNDMAAELKETRTALAKMVRCSKTMNLHQCADASQHAEAVLAKRPYLAPPEGDVVVTFDESMTRILFVTRQDEEGRIIKVIAEAPAQQDSQAVPVGWKLVPVEPTDEMCAEGLEDEGHTIRDGKSFARALYSAMLTSAPTPPAQRVMLTPDEIDLIDSGMCGEREFSHNYAHAIIDAYERKNAQTSAAPTPPAQQGEPDYTICPTCGGMASDPIVPRHERKKR